MSKNALFPVIFVIFSVNLLSAQQDSTQANIDSLMNAGKYKEVVEILTDSEKTDTLTLNEYKSLGKAYQNLYNFSKAFSCFSLAKQIFGYSYDVNFQLGKAALKIGQKDFAELAFVEILKNDSTNYLATIELANLLIDERKYDKAEPLFNSLSSSDTTNTYFLNRLAYCNWKMERYKRAIELYIKTLEINFFDPTASIQLGKIYYDSERYKEARYVLEKSLEGNRSNLGINKLLAESLFKLNKYEAAVVHYGKSLALGDSSAGVFQKLGFCYYFIAVSGNMINEEVFNLKMNEAITALTKAYERDENPLTTLYLGICYKELKNFEQARFYLEETINIIIPEYMVDVYTHLGAAFEYEEKYSEAISSYLEAYSYDPGRKVLLFYLASVMDRFYADREIPMIYYNKFLREDTTGNAALTKYAEDRIEKLREQRHFNGYK